MTRRRTTALVLPTVAVAIGAGACSGPDAVDGATASTPPSTSAAPSPAPPGSPSPRPTVTPSPSAGGADGTTHQAWLKGAVTGARAAGIPWVVVGMHKPCLSVGNYECDPGRDVVDLLLDTGVDLVVTGHEHLYQRTKPLALGAGCRSVRPGRFTPECVATRGGTTFVTVGTGVRDVHGSDTERRYFAALSVKDRDPSYGSLDVRVNANRLTATFVPVSGGRFTDRLVLTR